MLTRDALDIGMDEDGFWEETCSSCKFYDCSSSIEGLTHYGICRRNAPSPVLSNKEDLASYVIARWPQVSQTDFCGEFERARFMGEK